MKNERRAAQSTVGILVSLMLLLLAGCSYVTVDTRQYLGMPQYPPTNLANVPLLREPPTRPHIRIAEIFVEPQGNPPVTEIEQKLLQAAAKIGADAAVLVADRTMRMGAFVSGPWYGRQISPDFQRVIIAVAIKYTDQQVEPPPAGAGGSL
jgi:hypothetical protein